MIAEDLKALFDQAMIPHGMDGSDHEPYHYSPGELDDIKSLAIELVETIQAGKPVRIYFDNDGTFFRLVPDPKDTKMDKDCYTGLVRLTQFPNVTAMSLTGRDAVHARDSMLTPGYEVQNAAGRVIAQEGDRALRFSVIGSHGVEVIRTDGTITKHDFGSEANAFIAQFIQESVSLRTQYPGITIEDTKHGSVGINVSTIDGDEETKKAAYAKGLEILRRYESSASNPTHPDTGDKVFQIRKEGAYELELRPVGFGKDFGIRTFGNPDPEALTLFFCDSLGDHGTDRPAAEYINNPDHFANGSVIMVRNGRNQPVSGDAPFRVRATFANPTLVGQFLCAVANRLEQRPLILALEGAQVLKNR
jgi:trehalose-6-phosphatase